MGGAATGLTQFLDASAAGFDAALEALLSASDARDAEAGRVAARIVEDVRCRGDAALLEHCAALDGAVAASVAELELSPARCRRALAALDTTQRGALERAAERIRAFHERELEAEGEALRLHVDDEGVGTGRRQLPLERVGLYVPGGRGGYPSTVLMTALPARVAGVGEIIVTTPMPTAVGEARPMLLAAAAVVGVDRLFCIGGAQAIAALAFGTETVPKVDKIVGPGNRYVAAAKRLVYGHVGLDAEAGPSEVLIIADSSADSDWVALDLCAQAEHDTEARALLLSPDAALIEAVGERLAQLLEELPRREVIAASLRRHGALVKVADLDQAVALANRLAPEHLGLCVADPEALLPMVRHAGAVMLGHCAAEVLGDYCAGPSHVLPTGGAARYASVLGVRDFLRRSSLLRCGAEAAAALASTAAVLARAEGLEAHARSADARRNVR